MYSDILLISVLIDGRHSHTWQNFFFFFNLDCCLFFSFVFWISNEVWEATMVFLKKKNAKAGKHYTWQETSLDTIPLAVI